MDNAKLDGYCADVEEVAPMLSFAHQTDYRHEPPALLQSRNEFSPAQFSKSLQYYDREFTQNRTFLRRRVPGAATQGYSRVLSDETPIPEFISDGKTHETTLCRSSKDCNWAEEICDDCRDWLVTQTACRCECYDNDLYSAGGSDGVCRCDCDESPFASSSLLSDSDSSDSSVDYECSDENEHCTCPTRRSILATTTLSSLAPMSLLSVNRCAELSDALSFYDSLILPRCEHFDALHDRAPSMELTAADETSCSLKRNCSFSERVLRGEQLEEQPCVRVNWADTKKRSTLLRVSEFSHSSCVCTVLPEGRSVSGAVFWRKKKTSFLTKQVNSLV
jgi:hypothetical protein